MSRIGNSCALHDWILVIVLSTAVLLSSCDDDPTGVERPAITESSIGILEIVPESGSTVAPDDTVVVLLEFAIADDEAGERGFRAHISFVESETKRFAIGLECCVELVERSGEVTITYPLSLVWNDSRLQHPPRLYFGLARVGTPDNPGRVLAWTEEVVYAE